MKSKISPKTTVIPTTITVVAIAANIAMFTFSVSGLEPIDWYNAYTSHALLILPPPVMLNVPSIIAVDSVPSIAIMVNCL